MTDSRFIAFSALSKIEHTKAYSNLVLADYIPDNIDSRDKSFIFSLVKAVLERKITLDYNISLYLTQPIKKLKPQVLTALRMGAVQILYMDKIPDSAAINESVNIIKKSGSAFASGLVNAVLRKISVNGECLPENNDLIKFLSVKYSYSEYITKILLDGYGYDICEKIMQSSLEMRKLYLRSKENYHCDFNINPKIASVESDNKFIKNIVDNCYIYGDENSVLNNDDFKSGKFHIQDFSSQIASACVEPNENDVIIDVCSAPGGKSFTVAELMNDKGTVYSCDIHNHKIKLIGDGAKRLGLKSVKPTLNDGTIFNKDFGYADKVLCDVPCSAFGVVSKKPEIKYKDKSDVEELYDIQYKILEMSSRYVKSGGRLIYSTCTLNPKENIDNVNSFLNNHKEFHGVHILDGLECYRQGEAVTILPYSYDSDGFFIAVFERN